MKCYSYFCFCQFFKLYFLLCNINGTMLGTNWPSVKSSIFRCTRGSTNRCGFMAAGNRDKCRANVCWQSVSDSSTSDCEVTCAVLLCLTFWDSLMQEVAVCISATPPPTDCNPLCENGGTCLLASNLCQCPCGWTGQACKGKTAVCSRTMFARAAAFFV